MIVVGIVIDQPQTPAWTLVSPCVEPCGTKAEATRLHIEKDTR